MTYNSVVDFIDVNNPIPILDIYKDYDKLMLNRHTPILIEGNIEEIRFSGHNIASLLIALSDKMMDTPYASLLVDYNETLTNMINGSLYTNSGIRAIATYGGEKLLMPYSKLHPWMGLVEYGIPMIFPHYVCKECQCDYGIKPFLKTYAENDSTCPVCGNPITLETNHFNIPKKKY
jgi:hypothetical protein